MTNAYVEKVARDSFLTGLIKLGTSDVIKYLALKVPFFTLSIPAGIAKIVVEQILTIVVKNTSLGIYFLRVDLSVGKQAKDFERAAKENEKAQLSGDKKAIEKAERELVERARDLIKLGKI